MMPTISSARRCSVVRSVPVGASLDDLRWRARWRLPLRLRTFISISSPSRSLNVFFFRLDLVSFSTVTVVGWLSGGRSVWLGDRLRSRAGGGRRWTSGTRVEKIRVRLGRVEFERITCSSSFITTGGCGRIVSTLPTSSTRSWDCLVID